MQKLIIKTVIIVISCIIVVGCAVFGAFALFSPKIIGKLSDNIGNYSVSCWAYSRQYKLSETQEDWKNANFAYIDYALDLINDGEYEKATNKIVTVSICDKDLDQSVFKTVKSSLDRKLSNASQQDKIIILQCIEKINQKILE